MEDYIDGTGQSVDALLEEYRVYVDSDMASFIKHYLKSLLLDVELAMTRGETAEIMLGLSVMQDLVADARLRITEAKGSLGQAGNCPPSY